MNEPRSAIAQGAAAPLDPCAIFHDHIDHLYTLALLLTGDPDQAERCFVAGLDDCLEGKPLAQEWAASWARRAIIKNAIRVVSPMPDETRSAAEERAREMQAGKSGTRGFMTPITKLPPFERFVYVMSVLEGYSSGACAILLHCTVTEVAAARIRALQQLARGLTPDLEGFAGAPTRRVTVSRCS